MEIYYEVVLVDLVWYDVFRRYLDSFGYSLTIIAFGLHRSYFKLKKTPYWSPTKLQI